MFRYDNLDNIKYMVKMLLHALCGTALLRSEPRASSSSAELARCGSTAVGFRCRDLLHCYLKRRGCNKGEYLPVAKW
jgi:hypothetical protein